MVTDWLNLRASGVLLHPTSLPGAHGSGDFGTSAHRFIDWLHQSGQTFWQVLPFNPIGPGHSPYASASSMAGNPLLIALEPFIEKGFWKEEQYPVASVGPINYSVLIPWRLKQLRAIYTAFCAQASTTEKNEWAVYCAQEASWLDDYALFMVADAHLNADGAHPWPLWPKGLAWRDPQVLVQWKKEHAHEMGFWSFVQWVFDRQWGALWKKAREKNIAIIGDLPIYVAHHSADCWARPDLFCLDQQGFPQVVAGVPPDYFSPTGQRWGNPLYKWSAMSQEGFAWWHKRLSRQWQWADVVRIDHFRGLSAYWEIPADSPTAINGRWVDAPGHELLQSFVQHFTPHGHGHLPIIAEDLGLIDEAVIQLRDAFHLPGMRIAQFAFNGDRHHPYLPPNYPKNAIGYTGTHDNDTIVGWWQSADETIKNQVRQYLPHINEAHIHQDFWAWLAKSSANTVILPLQDALGLDAAHRMNTPGEMGAWEWRFDWSHIPPDLSAWLRDINVRTQRCPQI